jgi:hypothetical protein
MRLPVLRLIFFTISLLSSSSATVTNGSDWINIKELPEYLALSPCDQNCISTVNEATFSNTSQICVSFRCVCSESIYGLNYVVAKGNLSTCAASCGNQTAAENTLTTFENICSVVMKGTSPRPFHRIVY